MAFELPALSYAQGALEPHIDEKTMEIHHGKHHQAYVTNLNKAIANTPAEKLSIEAICKKISDYPVSVRNNGGGHFNHSLYWSIMTPGGKKLQSDSLLTEAIDAAFGSFEEFKEEFSKAGMARFGSGWAWLIKKDDGKLAVCSTPNQDNPLMDIAETKGTPILGMDVWEHAYYLKYQNSRPDYINAFFGVINWEAVSECFKKAVS